MTYLLKGFFLLVLASIHAPDALEFPQFLRGADHGRELQQHVTTLSKPVIATLITGLTVLDELCYTLSTLIYATRDLTAPVIAFHDTNSMSLNEGQKSTLRTCTRRRIQFVPVDFSEFAPGFVPQVGRDYTYEQSQRFYTSGMWNHSEFDDYDVIMRISHDTCLSHENPLLPYLNDGHCYQGHAVPHAYEIARKFSLNLYESAFAYITKEGSHPKFKELWSNVVQVHTDLNTVPVLNSDFEVVRKDFIRKPEVAQWLYEITELPPYGFYKHRWGTNAERYITLAIFAEESEISLAPIPGFVEKDFIGGRFFPKICRPGDNAESQYNYN